MCRKNKAKLGEGVGGEAARQRDINSLSEFNNRGGRGMEGEGEGGVRIGRMKSERAVKGGEWRQIEAVSNLTSGEDGGD